MAQNPPQNGHFMDAESIQRNFKNFQLHNHKCYTDEIHYSYIS